jgi:hypothetical protein
MPLFISRKLYITTSISTLPVQHILRINSFHLVHVKLLGLRYEPRQSNLARRAGCRTFPHNISTGSSTDDCSMEEVGHGVSTDSDLCGVLVVPDERKLFFSGSACLSWVDNLLH